jgi:tRNA threonylcarbamoyladenosine biosynthesis protein TsaE
MSSPAIVPEVLELPDERATIALGARLAGLAQPGDVIALRGELGTGKTTLARGFVRALADPAEEVPSPTFTLVQTYDTKKGQVWHFDLYRLQDAEDAWELGIEDAFATGISLIEWPERLGALLPARARQVTLEMDGAARRARLA